jgi:hypothetical protein
MIARVRVRRRRHLYAGTGWQAPNQQLLFTPMNGHRRRISGVAVQTVHVHDERRTRA